MSSAVRREGSLTGDQDEEAWCVGLCRGGWVWWGRKLAWVGGAVEMFSSTRGMAKEGLRAEERDRVRWMGVLFMLMGGPAAWR